MSNKHTAYDLAQMSEYSKKGDKTNDKNTMEEDRK
jgi:hypothetical protein